MLIWEPTNLPLDDDPMWAGGGRADVRSDRHLFQPGNALHNNVYLGERNDKMDGMMMM